MYNSVLLICLGTSLSEVSTQANEGEEHQDSAGLLCPSDRAGAGVPRSPHPPHPSSDTRHPVLPWVSL